MLNADHFGVYVIVVIPHCTIDISDLNKVEGASLIEFKTFLFNTTFSRFYRQDVNFYNN